LLWEQVHRHRRSLRGDIDVSSAHTAAGDENRETPKLQLVTPAPIVLPDVEGRKLTSVRFGVDLVELDLSGYRLSTAGFVVVATGATRLANQDTGWRDALCSIVGSRVRIVRAAPGERFELLFDNNRAVLMPRTSGTSSETQRARANES
jgi:hypothetical protein